MAKKIQKKDTIQKPIVPPVQKTSTNFSATTNGFLPAAKDFIPFAFCLLYMVIEFLPGFGGIDDMGAQWFYMVLLDLGVAIYILDKKRDFEFPATQLFKATFSKLYLAFFVLGGISILFAINRVESWVTYVRLIATIIGFFNLAILLYGRIGLFKPLAQVLGIILFVQSFQSLYLFFTEMGNYPVLQLVLALKGKAGNKNIYAASLIVKVPFVLYCIYSSKLLGRLLNIGIFFLAVLTIFLVNSRTSYLALIIQMIIFLAFCIWKYIKLPKEEKSLLPVYIAGGAVVCLVASLMFSQLAVSAAKDRFQDDATAGSTQIGSVTERLATLTNVAATEGNSGEQRVLLWKHASDYIKHHPLMGCGYGNWKLASIPYTKYMVDDLSVPIHAHNDFLEYATEMGIGGGLLYISLFICLLIYTIKVWTSKNTPEEVKLIAGFSLLAMGGFAVDAFFNFPGERPVNQLYFILIAALNIMAFYTKKDADEVAEEKQVSPLAKPLFAFAAILLLLPAGYVTFLTYQSLVVQNKVIPDLNNEPLKVPIAEVINAFPSIPNLSSSAQPIEGVLGRYLYEAKRYPEAIAMLKKGAIANPYIMYSEFLMADVYYADNQTDSAFKYATLSYNTKPRAKTYYQTLVAVCAKKLDSVTLKNAFRTFTKYRPNESLGYNLFLQGMVNIKMNTNPRGTTPQLLALVDSALVKFPGDKELTIRRNEIFTNMPSYAANNAAALAQNTNAVQMANQMFAEGTAAFNKGDFETAAQKFLRSSQMSNGTYGVYENIAICYFNLKQWDKSLPYFDRVLAMRTAVDGKTEYFKGAALINLGRPDEACALLKMSVSKKYPGSDALLAQYCAGK